MIDKIFNDLIIYLCDDADFKKVYYNNYNDMVGYHNSILNFISNIYNIDNYLVDRKYYDISWVELKDPEYNTTYIFNLDNLYIDYVEYLKEGAENE